MKDKVEKHHLPSMPPNTITIEIFTNLKYFNSQCCSTTLEVKLDHNLVKGLQFIGASKTCLQFDYIVTLKKEVPMSSFCSLNKANTLKPSTSASFSK